MLSAKKIPAGKSARIEAKINTNNLTGPVKKRITISSNDPGKATVTLVINAVVEPEIGMSDSQISFGDVPAAQEVVKEVILTVARGKSIRILSALSKIPAITAKLDSVPGSNGKKWRLIAMHKANTKPGAFSGPIVVKTDSRLTPEFSVYVRGVIVAAKK